MFFSDDRMTTAVVDQCNQTYLLNLEKTYDEPAFSNYMKDHWSDSLVYSAVYLVIIFFGQSYMQTREKFELRPYLATWSGLLAIFSIIGAYRTIPETILSLRDYGFEYSCCIPSYVEKGKVSSFWTMLFVWSKVFELGDTMFIVLRKQQLIFLHWYHHVTVLCYVWFTYPYNIAAGRWFIVMNYSVHSFMYSYYALRAMRYRFPKWVNIFITSLQLVQMIFGIVVNVVSYMVLEAGRECSQDYRNIRYSLAMYFSYLVLFANFFYTTYIAKKPIPSKKAD